MAKFVLIGSGLAGGLLAAYLGRRGYEVDLYERRAEPREGNIVGGRSINLAISTRGIHALEQIGIADEALRSAIPMRGRMIHDKFGGLHFSPYDVDPKKCINSIGRAALNTTVIEVAQRYSNVHVHFNHKCTDMDIDAAVAHLETANGAVTARGDAVIGVDGAFSAVRKSMQNAIANFQYDESYLAHGYKELTILPGPTGSWRMEKNALHIWPRKSFMMIALPNPDGSFTCTLFWEFEGPRSFATVKTNDDVCRFFDEEFPDAVPLMPGLLDDFRNNPTGSLVTIRCAPWFYRDKVCLVGDAAHAVVPFYGQGMNAAFEDCVVLDECLEEFRENREHAFATYFRRRKENADALADLAIGNFIEMRDKTASKTFRAKKKLHHSLEAALPGIYLPLYTMVTFTRMPYAKAAKRAQIQDALVYASLFLMGAILVAAMLWLIASCSHAPAGAFRHLNPLCPTAHSVVATGRLSTAVTQGSASQWNLQLRDGGINKTITMADTYVPMISSGVAGPLGVLHLPRLWLKVSLEEQGKLAPGYPGIGRGFDAMTCAALGLEEQAVKDYIKQKKPTYPEFEAWVKKNAKSLNQEAIKKHNAAVRGYIHDDETRKGVLGASRIADDASAPKDAVNLNNLDDWYEFHQVVLR